MKRKKITAEEFFANIQKEKNIEKGFEECENIEDIISILQKINDLFLTTYELEITCKNEEKTITISPVETEIYFSNEYCCDGMIHENERQKKHFGQLYFHRIKNKDMQWKTKDTDPIDIKSGGVDICLSNNDKYYLSVLIRSAYIKEVDILDMTLVSGITKTPNKLIKHMRIKDECIEGLLRYIEKESVIVKREKKTYVNIFHQPRISGKNYKDFSKDKGKFKFLLNSLNKGKNDEILKHIILDFKQSFYEKYKKQENKKYIIDTNELKKDFEKEKQTLY